MVIRKSPGLKNKQGKSFKISVVLKQEKTNLTVLYSSLCVQGKGFKTGNVQTAAANR